MRKSYIKMIEEENYTLRQRVDELDVSLRNTQKDLDEHLLSVQMTMTSCWTDGIDDYYTDTYSTYANEDDAICDVSMCMNNRINDWDTDKVHAKWRQEKLESCLNVKLIPKWCIEYWYTGLRFQKVNFMLHKKKKHFIRCCVLGGDKYRNFSYVEDDDAERMNAYIKGRNHGFFKKRLYEYINDSAYKESYTPYKYK
jgi:hypothetical protein